MNRPELLSPASCLTLKTAVQSGADAVYLGGSAFGARSFAENFDNEKLAWAIDYCHARGVKVYLTLNTLVTDKEMAEARRLAEFAANEGVDAFIVQDLGLAERIKCLGVPLHASTQLTVHNLEGVRLMKNLGFKRVVLAREMTRDEIAKIALSGETETEIFVHGALCMCYSGQCLMSSIIGGRSGNRGKCAQPCRLPYTIQKNGRDFGKGYFLSPRDLSLAQYINEIKDIGVTSLKIEGRMKGKEYVAAAVSTFAGALANSKNAGAEEMELLENSFSRGGSFTDGRFTGDKNILLTHKGNDDVYEIRDSGVLEGLKPLCDDKANFRKIPVDIKMKVKVGEAIAAEMVYESFKAVYSGKEVQPARSRAVEYDTVLRQLEKTGDYPIYINSLTLDTDGRSFLALSDINEVRRSLAENLISQITASFKRKARLDGKQDMTCGDKEGFTDIMVNTNKQLAAADGARYIFASYLLECEEKDNIITVFPDIIKEEHFDFFADIIEKRGLKKICTGNTGLIFRALEKGLAVWGTQALNIYNSESAELWYRLGLRGAQLSPELNIRDIKNINTRLELSVMTYGFLPVMKTANCPVSAAAGKCVCGDGEYSLKDRKNEVFRLETDRKQCITTIYNSKPIYMGDKPEDLKGMGCVLSFTAESGDRCREVIRMHKANEKFDMEFTRGHFYRGAL